MDRGGHEDRATASVRSARAHPRRQPFPSSELRRRLWMLLRGADDDDDGDDATDATDAGDDAAAAAADADVDALLAAVAPLAHALRLQFGRSGGGGDGGGGGGGGGDGVTTHYVMDEVGSRIARAALLPGGGAAAAAALGEGREDGRERERAGEGEEEQAPRGAANVEIAAFVDGASGRSFSLVWPTRRVRKGEPLVARAAAGLELIAEAHVM